MGMDKYLCVDLTSGGWPAAEKTRWLPRGGTAVATVRGRDGGVGLELKLLCSTLLCFKTTTLTKLTKLTRPDAAHTRCARALA